METVETLELGQELIVELAEADGNVLRQDTLRVTRVPGPNDPPDAFSTELISSFTPPERDERPGKGTDPLEVLKFAWQVIKDGKPEAHTEGAQTWVLYRDTHPLDYANAKEGHSGEFKFRVSDKTVPEVNLVEVRFFLEGAYDADPRPGRDIPHGQYLPSIFFGIPECHVRAPFMKLNAKAAVGPPYNVGGHDDVDPKVKIYLHFDLELFWAHHKWTYGFEAQGSEGFTGFGPV